MSHEKAYRCSASLTVECALALPLLLMALAVLCSIFDLLGALSRKNLELSNAARNAAVYAAAADSHAPEWIDLRSGVPLAVPFSIFRSRSYKAMARARIRSFTGFNAEDFPSGEEGSGQGTTVYMTDYESVYHTHADCTHLDLSITASDTASVHSLRNEYGRKYKPCDGFPPGYRGTVYITAKGDYYYPSLDYPSLTRSVRIESLDDTCGRPKCSRCAERDHAA